MKRDYTHITVILDRTGSMESIRDDTIGGFNAFLGEQKAEPGTATLTLVQFDSQDPYEVIHRFEKIEEIPELTRETYVPRAMTPLLDTLGRGINDLEASLSELEEAARPAKVIMAVVTDGQENASVEFTKGQVKKMIKEKTDDSSWEFVFLSADLEAIGEAVDFGIAGRKTLLFMKDSLGSTESWIALSRATSAYRSARSKSMEFRDDERKHPDDPEKKEKKKKKK